MPTQFLYSTVLEFFTWNSKKQLPVWFTDSEVFFKEAALKHFAILTSVFNKFSGLQVNTGFFLEYCKIFKSNYFEEHLRTAASEARVNQKWN